MTEEEGTRLKSLADDMLIAFRNWAGAMRRVGQADSFQQIYIDARQKFLDTVDSLVEDK